MAKCKICNSRKGKRECVNDNKLICSECCGSIRNEKLCTGCSYYSPPARRYQDISHFSVVEMESNFELQVLSNAIERSLCLFDDNYYKSLNDLIMIKLLELLLDKYHFKDENLLFDNDLIKTGFLLVDEVIQKQLKNVDETKIVKVIGVIRFVAKRRTTGRREYLTIIHEYVVK